MKIALVGLGYWGSKLLRNLVTQVGQDGIVAIDQHVDRVASALADYPGLTLRPSLEDALDEVDAVVIATPAETHADLARQALLAGRHVLVEKPLATSSELGRELVELAEGRDLRLMVGHTFLFSPRVEWIRDAIQSGRAGPIHYITSSRLNLGLVRADTNVIWDLAPHDLSIICHLLDELPSSVQTVARGVVRPKVPDTAFVNLSFASGTIATIALSWLAPRKVRNTVIVGGSTMIVYDDTDADEPVKLHDKGILMPEESADFGEHQLTYRVGDTVAPFISAHEPLSLELAHFIACIDTGMPCTSDGRFGLGIVEVIEAVVASWEQGGRPVALERHGLTPVR